MSSNIEIKRICQFCGDEFIARTTKTRYCSHTCNRRAYKEKIKADKIGKSNSETVKIKVQPLEIIKAKEFLTSKEVAILLGCSLRTVYRLINNGTLKAANLSKRLIRVKYSELNRMMERNNINA